MPRAFLAGLAALLASASVVEARPSTLSMTCEQATATVATAGSVVLSTGEHTFDRFVASNRFCSPSERAHPARAPTLDTPSCRLGHTCRHKGPRFSDDF